MIYAYDKVYLEKARTVLARMLDFAVYELKYDITQFFLDILHNQVLLSVSKKEIFPYL